MFTVVVAIICGTFASRKVDAVEGLSWVYSSPQLMGVEIGCQHYQAPPLTAELHSIPSGYETNIVIASSLRPAVDYQNPQSTTILSLKSFNSANGDTRWSAALPILSSTELFGKSRWESIVYIPVHDALEFANTTTVYTREFFSGVIFSLSKEYDSVGVCHFKLRGWSADSGILAWERTLHQSRTKVDDRGSLLVANVKRDVLSEPDISMLGITNGILFLISKSMDNPVVQNWSVPKAEDSTPTFYFSKFSPDVLFFDSARTTRIIAAGCYLLSTNEDNSRCSSSAAIAMVKNEFSEINLELVTLPRELQGNPITFLPSSIQLHFSHGRRKGRYNDVVEFQDINLMGVGCGDEAAGCNILLLALQSLSNRTSQIVDSISLPKSSGSIDLNRLSDNLYNYCITSAESQTCRSFFVNKDSKLTLIDGSSADGSIVIPVDSSVRCIAKSTHFVKHVNTGLSCINSKNGDTSTSFTFSIPLIQSKTQPYVHMSIISPINHKYRLFAVTNTGLVFVMAFTSLFPKPVFESVLWEKDEWPGHIKQAVVLDSRLQLSEDQQQQEDKLGTILESPKTPSDLVQQLLLRLQLQKEDLMEYAQEIIDGSFHLRDRIADLSATMLLTVECKFFASPQSDCDRLDAPAATKLTKADIRKRKQFGFDKYGVTLSYSNDLSNYFAFSRDANIFDSVKPGAVKYSESMLQVNAMKLLVDDTTSDRNLWKLLPRINQPDEEGFDPIVSFAKLFSSSAASTNTSSGHRTAVLFVSTLESGSYIWNIDSTQYNSLAQKQKSKKANQRKKIVTAAETCDAATTKCVSEMSLFKSISTHEQFPDVHIKNFLPVKSIFPIGSDQILLLHNEVNASTSIQLTRYTTSNLPLKFVDQFVHFVDKKTGELRIFKVLNQSCGSVECSCKTHCSCECVLGKPVASVSFVPGVEAVIDVAYPNVHDKIISKSSIRGDDSVLLKYLNPNMIAISAAMYSPTSEEPEIVAVSVTLVDAVSGRIITKLVHEWATLPVHCLIIENFIITTFWNSKFKRTELSSTALYDGAIDKFELSPFAGFMASSGSASSGPRKQAKSYPTHMSSFSAGVAPMTVQKTFILPRPVSAMQSTLTTKGITNKHILLSLSNGQVFDLDMKQIHPRRPLTDATQAEKEEGLMKYNPYVILSPLTALTRNVSVGWESGSGLDSMIASPVKLESSAMVFSFSSKGDGLAGWHITAVMPSQGFDQLAPDFNYALLVLILLGLAVAVHVMRRIYKVKRLTSMWA